MNEPVFKTVSEFGVCLALLTVSFGCSAQTLDSLNPNPSNFVYAVIQQPDGKILVGGEFTGIGGQAHSRLARLFPDGSLDPVFTNGPTYRNGASEIVNCLAIHTNGQVLIGGAFSQINQQGPYLNVGRFNSDGSLDTNFNLGYINNYVKCLLIQPDSKILIGGSFTKMNSPTNNLGGLCRINWDGSLDTNFNAMANGAVNSIVLQSNGKILAEGFFTSIGGESRTNLARLNSDGSADDSFQTPVFTLWGKIGNSGPYPVVLVQPDGKILVGGLFDKVNGEAHTNIVRLNADGSVDSAFNAQADLSGSWGVQALTLQTDGKILIGDDSRTLNGVPYSCLGRLNADGSLDPTFNTNLVNGPMVYSATLQPDGKILTGGWFSKLSGQTRKYLGRLFNTDPATQSLTYDGTDITWLRGGASPEVWRATFEASADGTNWTCLGDGVRVSGGWQLSNVSIATNASIRARGFVVGGRENGSCWFVESVYPQTEPRFVTDDGNLACHANQFGSDIAGSAGSTAIVDASTNLLVWAPIATNLLYSGPFYFSDPAFTNSPNKFYRVHL